MVRVIAHLSKQRNHVAEWRQFSLSILMSVAAVFTTLLCRRFGYILLILSPFRIVAVLTRHRRALPFRNRLESCKLDEVLH